MDKAKDSKMLLLQCVGNTCKLINVGKCPDATPIQDVNMELPINYNRPKLPDIAMSNFTIQFDDNDEE